MLTFQTTQNRAQRNFRQTDMRVDVYAFIYCYDGGRLPSKNTWWDYHWAWPLYTALEQHGTCVVLFASLPLDLPPANLSIKIVGVHISHTIYAHASSWWFIYNTYIYAYYPWHSTPWYLQVGHVGYVMQSQKSSIVFKCQYVIYFTLYWVSDIVCFACTCIKKYRNN